MEFHYVLSLARPTPPFLAKSRKLKHGIVELLDESHDSVSFTAEIWQNRIGNRWKGLMMKGLEEDLSWSDEGFKVLSWSIKVWKMKFDLNM